MRGPEWVEALESAMRVRECMRSHTLLQQSSITLYPFPVSFCSLKLSPSPPGKRLLWNPFYINYLLFHNMPCNQSGELTMNNLAFQICFENRNPKFCWYRSWSTGLLQHVAGGFHKAKLEIYHSTIKHNINKLLHLKSTFGQKNVHFHYKYTFTHTRVSAKPMWQPIYKLCILTGASVWQVTAPNKGGLAKMSSASFSQAARHQLSHMQTHLPPSNSNEYGGRSETRVPYVNNQDFLIRHCDSYSLVPCTAMDTKASRGTCQPLYTHSGFSGFHIKMQIIVQGVIFITYSWWEIKKNKSIKHSTTRWATSTSMRCSMQYCEMGTQRK